MAKGFDPYHKWLGIRPEEQPPDHYRLLGITRFESDPDVIDAAASKQTVYLQGCATGPHLALSQKLLNEIAAARLCLLNAKKKTQYDQDLREKLAATSSATSPDQVDGDPAATSPSLDFLTSTASPEASPKETSSRSAGRAKSDKTSPASLPRGRHSYVRKYPWQIAVLVGGTATLGILGLIVGLANTAPKTKTAQSPPETSSLTSPAPKRPPPAKSQSVVSTTGTPQPNAPSPVSASTFKPSKPPVPIPDAVTAKKSVTQAVEDAAAALAKATNSIAKTSARPAPVKPGEMTKRPESIAELPQPTRPVPPVVPPQTTSVPKDDATKKLKVLRTKTDVFKQHPNYARFDGLKFDVGIGNDPKGVGIAAVGYEFENVDSLKADVNVKGKLHALDRNSFVGFMVDYHTAEGYKRRVAISLGMYFRGRIGVPRGWGTGETPNVFVDFKNTQKNLIDLRKWAPPDWDGRTWFTVLNQNGGHKTSITGRLIILDLR